MVKDTNGVIGLPVRMVVTVIVLAIMIVILSTSFSNFMREQCERQADTEVDKIASVALEMYLAGGARNVLEPEDKMGSNQTIEVRIPDCVNFAVFGALPRGGEPPMERGEKEANNYFYVLDNGKTVKRSSTALFVNRSEPFNEKSPFVLYPGEYNLVLELVKHEKDIYVMLYGE